MDRDEVFKLKDPPTGIGDQVINALIIAGFNAFSTLVGLGATGLLADLKVGIVSAVISAGVSFFGSLMAQRGLAKGSQTS